MPGSRPLTAVVRPDAVINAANRQPDWDITADGGALVALAAAAVGARLVHVSSDAVFSGRAPRYDDASRPDPVTPYGAAKAAAETGADVRRQPRALGQVGRDN